MRIINRRSKPDHVKYMNKVYTEDKELTERFRERPTKTYVPKDSVLVKVQPKQVLPYRQRKYDNMFIYTV